MFRVKSIIAIAALAVLAGCATTNNSEQGQPLQEQELATQAADVLQAQAQQPADKRIPEALVNDARCIAVFPSVTQVAFIVGGKRGHGLLACRKQGGQRGWTRAAPVFYTLTGGSVGFQAGAQSSSLILLFLTPDSVRQLTQNDIKFGADVGIAAGPVGYNASVQGAPAPVVSYRRSKGLFAGVNLNGSTMNFDADSTEAVYGQQVADPHTVLFQMNRVPSSVDAFNQALAKLAPPAQSISPY